MKNLSSVLVILFVLLIVLATQIDASKRRFNPVSKHAVQPQHSLTTIDQSQVYWTFGGSTVLTKTFARLVPAIPNRRGWLWNEYPLEQSRFEVEFTFEIASKPHYGGDGFALWFVSSKDNTSSDVESINGPLFGMNEKFTGIGIIFDVYDNDSKKNNPMISVIKNSGQNMQFNLDHDLEGVMITTSPRGSYRPDSHRCRAELRNLGRKVQALAKVQEEKLHLYLNSADGNGWKLCLAVDISAGQEQFRSLKDMHIAFTASTSQVADSVDISEVNTRYHSYNSNEVTDTDMEYTDIPNPTSHWTLFILLLLTLGLLAYIYNDLTDYRAMKKARLDISTITNRLNQTVREQFYVHAICTVLMLFTGWWLPLLLNLPLAGIRVFQFVSKALLLTPSSMNKGASTSSSPLNFILTLSPELRLISALLIHGITSIYFIIHLLL